MIRIKESFMTGVISRVARKLAQVSLTDAHECNICGRSVGRFLPYRGGWRGAPVLMRVLRMTGSDLDHYLCPRCGANDRERHLLAYLTAAGVLSQMTGKSPLQFAPEPMLTAFFDRAGLARHVRADLFPTGPGIERIDMLSMPYPDETFDFVIANHVLEHVADDWKGLHELRRVLRRGGLAILQTPFSAVLERMLCDPGVSASEERLQLYGQEDHVRLYGRDIFGRIASAGFESRVKCHDDLLADYDPVRYGMNRDEPFFLFARL